MGNLQKANMMIGGSFLLMLLWVMLGVLSDQVIQMILHFGMTHVPVLSGLALLARPVQAGLVVLVFYIHRMEYEYEADNSFLT
jgi:hypothetical protein